MARLELERRWTVPSSDRDRLKREFELVLLRHGLRDTGSTETELRVKGGSQAFRVLGGWISPRRWYPRLAVISFHADGPNVEVIARVEDAMGLGHLDARTKRKYTLVLTEVLDELAQRVPLARP